MVRVRKPESLLVKAMSVPAHRGRPAQAITAEDIELVRAYLDHEVTGQQIATAKEFTRMNVVNWAARTMRRAYDLGYLVYRDPPEPGTRG